MGLLDELREKAEEQRTKSALQAATEAELYAYYRSELLPRMHLAYKYFQELAEHLKVVDQTCTAEYPVLPGIEKLAFTQNNYSVLINSREEPTQLELRCDATLPEPVSIEVDGKAGVLRYSKLLDSYELKYERTDNKDMRYEIESARFKLIGPIPVRIAIKTHIENRQLAVIFKNFETGGTKALKITPDKVNDEFLDRLGRYILRQPVNLFSTEMSDEAKRKLRETLERKRQEEAREQRTLEAERAAQEQAEYERRPSVRLSRALRSAREKFSQFKNSQ